MGRGKGGGVEVYTSGVIKTETENMGLYTAEI